MTVSPVSGLALLTVRRASPLLRRPPAPVSSVAQVALVRAMSSSVLAAVTLELASVTEAHAETSKAASSNTLRPRPVGLKAAPAPLAGSSDSVPPVSCRRPSPGMLLPVRPKVAPGLMVKRWPVRLRKSLTVRPPAAPMEVLVARLSCGTSVGPANTSLPVSTVARLVKPPVNVIWPLLRLIVTPVPWMGLP
jgi:hypothetical protein